MATNIWQAEQEAKEIVNKYTIAAAAGGWVPHACLVLTPMQIKMCHDVASCFAVKDYTAATVIGSVGAALGGHAVVDTVLTYIPILGWAAKTVTAGSVTALLGEALIQHFKECSPLS
jgi:uncharacterized protein (DUF697 family)